MFNQWPNKVYTICPKLASMPARGFEFYNRTVNQSLINNLEEQLKTEANLQAKAEKPELQGGRSGVS